MQPISELLVLREVKNPPRHQTEAGARAICDFLVNDKMSFGYWLKKTKGVSFGDVQTIIKSASDPKITNRAGFIVWKLKQLSTPTPRTRTQVSV